MNCSRELSQYQKAIHDIMNPVSAIYASLCVIEMQNPEVKNMKYWKDTMQDMEDLKELLVHYSLDSLNEKI